MSNKNKLNGDLFNAKLVKPINQDRIINLGAAPYPRYAQVAMDGNNFAPRMAQSTTSTSTSAHNSTEINPQKNIGQQGQGVLQQFIKILKKST